MMHGLNTVYGQRNRGSLSHYLRAYILTAILVTVAIVALLTLVVAPVALAFVPFGALSFFLLDALRWIVAVGVIYFGIALLYRFGVNRSVQKARWWTPGALLAIVSWAILSFAFSYYVANFGTYNEVYGSIGAVIAMLVWLWISSFLVLLGAVLNFQLEAVHSLWTQDAAEADLPEPAEVVEQVISDGEGPEATEEEEVTVAEAQKPDSPSAA
jgi:membrane protein